MKTFRSAMAVAAVAVTLVTGGMAVASDKKAPDGTVSIDETQFALVIGGSTGGGKLMYQGKEYEFKLKGLTVGVNVGVTKMQAAGEVYDLPDISKFPGTYTKFDASATLGGGAGALYLKNENGVVMKLFSRNQGVQLNVGSASGVKVTLK
jgi:hypothetical protein